MDGFYLIAAELIVVLHVSTIVFEVTGQILALVGRSQDWRWIHNVWFRSVHLEIIVIVTIESWFGLPCPLTFWEQWLREKAGQPVEQIEFIACWSRKLFGVDTPPWVLTAVYTAFCASVLWTWWSVPPRLTSKRGTTACEVKRR